MLHLARGVKDLLEALADRKSLPAPDRLVQSTFQRVSHGAGLFMNFLLHEMTILTQTQHYRLTGMLVRTNRSTTISPVWSLIRHSVRAPQVRQHRRSLVPDTGVSQASRALMSDAIKDSSSVQPSSKGGPCRAATKPIWLARLHNRKSESYPASSCDSGAHSISQVQTRFADVGRPGVPRPQYQFAEVNAQTCFVLLYRRRVS